MATSGQPDQTLHYQMLPVTQHQQDAETVFNIVNYAQPVQDEIDEGYSTNYSPSSKSTSSFECDTSFDKSEVSNSDIQVCRIPVRHI